MISIVVRRGSRPYTQRMNRRIYYRIMMLFMISGAAALIYQVCWQRLLFESVGVDIESVTIIVSTFMLGLGLGALVGGELADRFPDWTLTMFGIIELATAAFGALSSYLIHAVSLAVIHASTVETIAANFGLLLCPTLMMGATLPILVKRVMQLYQNVGASVGALYFANTMGVAWRVKRRKPASSLTTTSSANTRMGSVSARNCSVPWRHPKHQTSSYRLTRVSTGTLALCATLAT